MEDIFTQLAKDATGSKHRLLREACTIACDTLDAQNIAKTVPTFQLREICLEPIKLAFESKNNKIASFALGGLQKLTTDERFKSNLSEENEENQMTSQILNTISMMPSLHDDLQLDILKFLLMITCSEVCVINAKTVIKIAELCTDVYEISKVHVKNKVKATLTGTLRNFAKFYTSDLHVNEPTISHHASIEPPCSQDGMNKICTSTFKASHQASTHTAVKATLTQMLSSISLHLKDRQNHRNDDADDIVAEFHTNGASSGPTQALCEDVVNLLEYFCKKLENAHKKSDKFEDLLCLLPSDFFLKGVSERLTGPQSQQLVVLYLESILAILSSSSADLKLNDKFLNLVW
ncbi:brefeldin A-inhibited guanine nucleotide-exchange protein 3-like [Saccoglossus kowalevskii]